MNVTRSGKQRFVISGYAQTFRRPKSEFAEHILELQTDLAHLVRFFVAFTCVFVCRPLFVLTDSLLFPLR